MPYRFGFKKPVAKYRARRVTTADGHSFPSQIEANRWGQLQQLQAAGHLSELSRQPKVLLTRAAIVYHPDFKYLEAGRWIYEETKGFETEDYKIKKKLWTVYGPAPLRIMKTVKGQGISMVEEIVP